jgi:hypothetical protein
MKVALLGTILALTLATASYAQATAPTPVTKAPAQAQVEDENAPQLTIDEKLALVKLDLQKQAALDEARKALTKKVAPIQADEDALKLVIEQKYPGYTLVADQSGYKLVKKAEKADKK